jgi:hypothetical protein
MNYSENVTRYKSKFSTYTANQCEYAIKDIDEVLKINSYKEHTDEYITKLLIERDCAIERKYKIQGRK